MPCNYGKSGKGRGKKTSGHTFTKGKSRGSKSKGGKSKGMGY